MESARKRRIAVLVGFTAIVTTSFAAWIFLPRCKLRPKEVKEAVLRQNLDTLRKTIDAYTYDKRKAPHSLQDLVTAGYLKKIPGDPITGQANWEVVTADTMTSVDQTEPGINNVHSTSQQQSTERTAYNTW